jgi:hypothetical protein
MKVQVLTSAEAERRLRARCAGADPVKTIEGLAELCRAEAAALGKCPRRVLADRVCALLRAVGGIPAERAQDVIHRLEEQGDLLAGPGGYVAAAPLRAIHAGPGHHLLLGGIDSVMLGAALGFAISPSVIRRLRSEPAGDKVLAGTVTGLGGRVLSIEAWAGLDRTPPADAAWLAALEERLHDPLESIAAAEAVLAPAVGDIEYYVAGEHRWRRVSAAPGSPLLRARQPFGWFAYAWLAGEPAAPQRREALRLGRDEARRTQFALDAGAGQPLPLRLESAGAASRLHIEAPLPYAEYRFLLGFAERSTWEGLPICYSLAAADVPRVSACLAQRLGIRIEHVSTEAP